MACPGDARADALPSPHSGAPCRGSWFSTWAGDDSRPACEQTVLKSGVIWGDTINGIDVRHPNLFLRPRPPTASFTRRSVHALDPDAASRANCRFSALTSER